MSKRTLIAVVYTLTVVVATAYGKVDISCDYPGGSVIVRGIDETNGVVNGPLAEGASGQDGRRELVIHDETKRFFLRSRLRR